MHEGQNPGSTLIAAVVISRLVVMGNSEALRIPIYWSVDDTVTSLGSFWKKEKQKSTLPARIQTDLESRSIEGRWRPVLYITTLAN